MRCKNNEVSENLEKLMKLSRSIQDDAIKLYPLEMLELLAIELYEESIRNKYLDINDLLDDILSERTTRLNSIFEWTDENKEKLLKINDTFMHVFEKAYNKAFSSAQELEKKIKKNDEFIKDYEIEINVTPYLQDKFYGAGGGIGFALSEPLSGHYLLPLNCSINHRYYPDTSMPIYLDKTRNWNIEYFDNIFVDNYIGYAIHALLDTGIWSFHDIINIAKIQADIEITYQYYTENV
jgi:hypothetical protein